MSGFTLLNCSKDQGPVNLTFTQRNCGTINFEVYMETSKRLGWKQLNEIGENMENEEDDGNKNEEVSNLLRPVSVK